MISFKRIDYLYNIIWQHINKKYQEDKNKQIYQISYNYNKDNNALEILNDYYANNTYIYEIVKITETDYKILKKLLLDDGFYFSHHYIYISKKYIENYMQSKTDKLIYKTK